MFLVVLLYALFAGVFVIAKTGLQYVHPFFFVGARMTLAGILLLGYMAVRDPDRLRVNRSLLWKLLLLGAFNIYLTNAFEFWGLQYLTPAKTCFIYSLTPFLSAFFSYFALAEKVTKRKWLGLVVGFVGFIPILLSHGEEEVQVDQVAFLSWAEISVLVAATSTVYGWIVMRELVHRRDYCPIAANGWSMLFGGIMALINSAFVEPWDPFPYTELRPFLQSAIALIVISSFICYNLYGFLLKRYTATFLAFAGFMTPIFTAILEWIFLGELVSGAFVLSAVIVFCGLLLFYQEELKKEGIRHVEEEEAMPAQYQ